MSSTAIKDFKKVANEQVTRLAQTAISKGAVLQYHTDFINVVELALTKGLGLACGVATEDAAAGEQVRMVVRGVADVLIDGAAAVAIGDRLVIHTATTGVLIKDAAVAVADTTPLAIPLEAQATNSAAGTLTKCVVRFS